MTGAEIMAVVAFFVMVSGALWGIWWKIDGKVSAARSESMLRAEGAAALASQARAELAEHKLHVAETYVSKQGLRETTDQLMVAISGVKAAVDGMTIRIDRVVENQNAPKSAARRATG